MRAPGQQPALDEREPLAALQRAVFGRGGFRPRLRLFRHVDLVFHRVLEQIPLQPSLGGLRPAADDAEVGLVDLAVADLIVQDAQRLGVFRRDDDAAGVAVDAVAERGGEGVFGLRVPFAALTQVGLNVRDERVPAPFARTVAQDTGLFVRQQNVLVLVDDVQPRRRNFQPGIFLRGSFKKLVIDV